MTKKMQTTTEFVSGKASDMDKININFQNKPLVKTSDGFSSVIDTGLITNVWKELDKALGNIGTFTSNTKSLMSKYIVELEEKDKEGADAAKKISTPKVSSISGGGSSKKTSTSTSSKPTGGSKLDSAVASALENATPAEVAALLGALNNLADENGVTLDELLTNPAYATQVAETINNLANGSELALAISNMDNPQETLNNLINNGGAEGILNGSKEEIDATLEYLENVAKENGITLEQLLTDPKYADLLKTSLEKLKAEKPGLSGLINSILSQSSPQLAMLSLLKYGSNKIGTTEQIDETLEYLENVAKENGISLEQLLTDPKYADLLKASLEKLKEEKPGLASLINSILSQSSPQLVLLSLLKYGSDKIGTKEEINETLEYLENVAKENGITLEELLTDPKYADLLRTSLEKLKEEKPNLANLIDSLLGETSPQLVLLSLLKYGNNKIGTTEDIDSILEYLEGVAKENGITLEQLLTDPKYADLLKTSLEKLKNEEPKLGELINSILSQSSPQLVLLSLLKYGSERIGTTEEINETLAYLEKIAKENGITLEELLTDPKYADLLRISLEKLKEENPSLADFINSLLKESSPQLVLLSLLKYGDASIGHIKSINAILEYLEGVAKENGITLEQLLTDSKYADLLKISLEKLKISNPELENIINLILSEKDPQKALMMLINGVMTTDPKAIEVLKDYLEGIAKENGITLEQLLTDPKYSDLLKVSLTNFGRLYPLLLGLSNSTPEVIQAVLEEIFKGNYPGFFGINEITVNGVFNYLELIAKRNGITLEQLLRDPRYSDILKVSLESFKKALPIIKELNSLSATDLQIKLYSIYNGSSLEGLDQEVVDLLKAFLVSIAELNGITIEELLTNPKYAELLKQSMIDFEKIAMFMSTIAELQEMNMRETILMLYEAVNPKALGFTNDNIKSIYDSLKSIATQNNLRIDELLENGELLKSKLCTIDQTQILRILYSNSSEETIKKVMNNICGYAMNTKIVE